MRNIWKTVPDYQDHLYYKQNVGFQGGICPENFLLLIIFRFVGKPVFLSPGR